MKVHYSRDGTCWTQIYIRKEGNKRIYKRIYGKDTNDLNINVLEEKLKNKKISGENAKTLREGISAYIELRRPHVSPATISKYESIRDHAFPNIMDKKMTDITDLEGALRDEAMRYTSNHGGKQISTKTLHDEYGLVKTVLQKYTPGIFRKSVSLKPVKRSFPPLIEPEKIIALVYGTDMELPVMLAMWLSMTVSEIRGLTKSESLDGEYITIRSVMLTVNGKDVRKDLAKEVTRNRRYRLPERLRELIDGVDGNIIVPRTNASLTHRLSRMLAKAGLPHISFHELRHINASTMARLQIPKKTACKRGGWATEYIMDTVYTQVFDLERIAADKKIDAYFEEAYATVRNTFPSADPTK